MSAPRKVVATLVAALAGALLAGCGPSAPGSAASGSGASGSGATGPLAMDQRVAPGDLAGLKSVGAVQTATSPDAYAKLVNPDDPQDPDLADKRAQDLSRAKDSGFVGAAVKNYGNNDTSWGISVAIQLGSPQQAVAYEQRLYDEQFANELPPDAAKGTVTGPTVSHTLVASGDDEGKVHTLAMASFVDGSFVYVNAAGGVAPDVTPEAGKTVIETANALFPKVKGHPAS